MPVRITPVSKDEQLTSSSAFVLRCIFLNLFFQGVEGGGTSPNRVLISEVSLEASLYCVKAVQAT